MKIGLVLDDTLDTPDGVQQYVLNVGSWLSEQGHEVHYLVGRTVRSDVPNVHSLSRNVTVKFNGNRMSMPLPPSRRSLKQFLAVHQFDVLHVQVPYSPFLAGRLIALASPHTAVVGTFHILPYSGLVRLANRGLALLNHSSAKRFNQMIANSEPSRMFAASVYHYPHMVIVPNPVRLGQFAGAVSASPEVNVVFLGRLVERKGAQYLLQALAYMFEHNLCGRTFKLHIGGKGALLGGLQQYVAQHGLSDVVSFVGFVDEAQKANFLAAADIAVFPSTSGESFGIVLLEAMAAARGVVLAGNNPGYASVMHGVPDQLFDPKDIPAFAEKLASWLHNAAGRQAAHVAQKAFVGQFDIGVVGTQLCTIYKEALQSLPKT